MKRHLKQGDKVIARKTCTTGSFIKGDILEINSKGIAFDYNVVNVTRPELGLGCCDTHEIKLIYKIKSKIYFLGIPIITIKDVKYDE